MLRYINKNEKEFTLGWLSGTESTDEAITKIRANELVGIRLMFKGEKPRHYDVSFDSIDELKLKIKKNLPDFEKLDKNINSRVE